jgi:hypothetical protein
MYVGTVLFYDKALQHLPAQTRVTFSDMFRIIVLAILQLAPTDPARDVFVAVERPQVSAEVILVVFLLKHLATFRASGREPLLRSFLLPASLPRRGRLVQARLQA